MRGGKSAALLAGSALSIFAFSTAVAQPVPGPSTPAAQGVEAPRSVALSIALGVSIRDQKWDEAQAVLDSMTPEERAYPEVRFIEAFIARQRGDPLRAIELYQRLLDEDAMLARVRLELAQTFMEIGDDRAAEQNFRFALTSNLPPEVRASIDAALEELAGRHRWRYSVSLAIAPDSNVNAATDAEQAYLFGLPFELSDEARRTSGVNATLALGADRAFAAQGPRSVVVGAGLRYTDNEEAAFDDATASARLGVQRVSGGSRFELSLIGDRRWFGGDWLSRSSGVELRQRFSDGRTVHDLAASAVRLDYDQRDDRDAWVFAADWSRTHYVSPNYFWRGGLGLRRVEAETASESFSGVRLSVGAYRALPAGFGLWIEPAYEQRDFDEASVLFGQVRRDEEISLSLRGIKRDVRVWGYSPYLGVEVARNDSTVTLQEYDRTRVEFGLTRTF